MARTGFIRCLTALLCNLACSGIAWALPPVLEDPVPAVAPGAAPVRVAPVVPVGKALVLPLVAYGEGRLSFRVTSSNPKVYARVRTGNPLLRLDLRHSSSGAGDPAYTGTVVFQLFRNWTPVTADLIGGFAQGGLFDAAQLQRLADLNAGNASQESFIYQGGASVPFNFENEFQAPLIFAGRGQLAMANAGTNNYQPTNGGQFFITHGNLPRSAGAEWEEGGPRHLDFKHTIFGQLTHGWDVLDKLRATPRNGADRPLADVKVDSARVVENYDDGAHEYTDAVLVLSAIAEGSSVITVTVSDAGGQTGMKQFTATARRDTHNAPPFVVAPPDAVGPKDRVFIVPVPKAVDLECDYLTMGSKLIDVPAVGQTAQQGGSILLLGNPGYEGPMNLGVGVTAFDPSYRGAVDGAAPAMGDSRLVRIGVGAGALEGTPVVIEGRPAVSLAGVVVGRVRTGETRSGAANFSASINWGDGSAPTSGIVAAETGRPAFGAMQVKGTHLYTNPGVYPVAVTVTGSKGARTVVRSTAVVSANPLSAQGQSLVVNGLAVSARTVATFTDQAPVAAARYTAHVDWGDGESSAGVVRALGAGRFAVLGTHRYVDGDVYALRVHVHKQGDASSLDATAWGSVRVVGVAAPAYLPPFPQAHLVGSIGPVSLPAADASGVAGSKPVRELVGTGDSQHAVFTFEMVVINSGNIASLPAKARFYLSTDVDRFKGEPVPAADILLDVGRWFKEINLPALQPGAGVRVLCDEKGLLGFIDSRPHSRDGETGSGCNLLAVLEYADPVADLQPIAMSVVYGPFGGLSVTPGSLALTEASGLQHSATLQVGIDRAPRAGETCSLRVTSSDPSVAVISPQTLTFTSANWSTKQSVTVTAVDDALGAGNRNCTVTVAVDAAQDPRFFQYSPVSVSVRSTDDDPVFVSSRSSLTTREAVGGSGSFTLKLSQAPAAGSAVVVNISSSKTAEGVVSPAMLTFDSTNWNTARTVLVTGVDDNLPDGDKSYQVTASVDTDPAKTTDPRFLNLASLVVNATNRDNEPVMTISPATLQTSEAPSFAGAQFRVRFDQLPASDVTVSVTVENPAEGTIDKQTLTFAATNASTDQVITVRGVDDSVIDGPKTYRVIVGAAVSADPRFSGVLGGSVSVTNLDDD